MILRATLSHTVLLVFLSCAATAAPSPRIAIIIDDLGWQLAPGQRVIDLPGPVACAVLPETPLGAKVAELAHTWLAGWKFQAVEPTSPTAAALAKETFDVGPRPG